MTFQVRSICQGALTHSNRRGTPDSKSTTKRWYSEYRAKSRHPVTGKGTNSIWLREIWSRKDHHETLCWWIKDSRVLGSRLTQWWVPIYRLKPRPSRSIRADWQAKTASNSNLDSLQKTTLRSVLTQIRTSMAPNSHKDESKKTSLYLKTLKTITDFSWVSIQTMRLL